MLCLAARIGTEVRAFHDVGAFAVGIDLEPGGDNRWVLPGDFHQLIFPDESVDAVYCNSFDHALDLPKVLGECRRVLKRDGQLIVDLQTGSHERAFDDWAATSWRSVNDAVHLLETQGFPVAERRAIASPWIGEEVALHVSTSAGSLAAPD